MYFLDGFVLSLLYIVPLWRICARAGFGGGLSLVAIAPGLGMLIVGSILSCARWPQKSDDTTDMKRSMLAVPLLGVWLYALSYVALSINGYYYPLVLSGTLLPQSMIYRWSPYGFTSRETYGWRDVMIVAYAPLWRADTRWVHPLNASGTTSEPIVRPRDLNMREFQDR